MLHKLILCHIQTMQLAHLRKEQELEELHLEVKVEVWFKLSSTHNTAIVKLIFYLKQEMDLKQLKLLKKESSIKMEKLAIDNILKANSWVKEVLQNAMNLWDVIIKKLQLQKLFWNHHYKEVELNKN